MGIELERQPGGTVEARNIDRLRRAVNHPVPQARVYNSANISINNVTTTALTFDSERWDHGDLHSTSANTGRLTVALAGLYEIGGCIMWAGNATGARYAAIRINGTDIVVEELFQAPGASDGPRNNVSTQWRMEAGDYAELVAYQSSGGSLNVTALAPRSPEFWIARLAGYENIGIR